MIRVGCCGFQRGMKKYFENFSLVEVQSTFYRPPRATTAENWRKEAPGNFEFAVKAWQVITHPSTSPTYRKAGLDIPVERKDRYGSFKPTDEVFDAWEVTKKICEILNADIVVIQCPTSFKPTKENLENMSSFFSSVERGKLNIAWEPRGGAWENRIVRRLCEELDLIHAVDPFLSAPCYIKDASYFRLHGSPPGDRMYMYKYKGKDIQWLLRRCRRLEKEAKDVYCLFNNMSMYEDAMKFRDSLKKMR